VISTPMGAEGIACTDGHDILLADSAAEMVARMCQVLDAPERCAAIGRNARELVERAYNNALITRELDAFMRSLCAR